MSSGDEVSASSKITTSSGACRASSAMKVDGCIGVSPSKLAVGGRVRLELAPLLRAEVGDAGRRGRPRVGRERALELVRDQAERDLRVGDEPEVDREVLRDLVRVEVDVHDLRARRAHALERGEDLGEDVRAADQHGVRLRT